MTEVEMDEDEIKNALDLIDQDEIIVKEKTEVATQKTTEEITEFYRRRRSGECYESRKPGCYRESKK